MDEGLDAHLDPDGTRGGSVAEDSKVSLGAHLAWIDLGLTDDQFGLPYMLDVRPSPEFNYEAAKNKLVNLRIGSDTGPKVTFVTPGDAIEHEGCDGGVDAHTTGKQGKLLRLSGWIDIDSRITVGCAGAVLTYLQRRKAVEYLPGDQSANLAFRINTIEMFSLNGTM